MLKRWDTKVYDIRCLLDVYDTLSIDLESMDIPSPKVHDLCIIIKALIIKEFEGLSLRAAEIRVQEVLGERIDHAVLHFWEKKLSSQIEEILNRVLENLEQEVYSKTFVDSTVFTNKKKKVQEFKQ
jgi:hypothetical protein